MNFMRVRFVLLGLIFILAFSFSHAQVIPTAKLIGTVVDTEGLPIPGATVTINSPSLILPQMVSVTNEKGFYRFPGLPSGIYKEKVEMPGMKTVVREGIIVTAGQTTTLNFRLELTTIEETVTVVGEAPIIDLQSTTMGINYKKEFLHGLPLSRGLSTIYNLAPGMYDRTAHGSDARSNKFTVDGIKHNSPMTGDPIMEVGYSAMEEVMIDTGGHKAEYGSAKGAVVQVITKSGGNDFHGEVAVYFRHNKFEDDNTEGTPFEGQFVGFDYEYLPAFSLGGPLMKEKVWFFTSFDMLNYQWYVQGYPERGTKPHQPCDRQIYSPLVKLTWQIDPKNKLVASTYWRGYYQHHRGATNSYTVDVTRNEDRGGWLHSLQWSRVFTKNFFINIRGGYFDFHQYLLAKNDQPKIYDYSDRIYRGGYQSDGWLTRDRYQFFADATYFVDDWFGIHEFKTGANFEWDKNCTHYEYHTDPRFEGWFEPGFNAAYIYLQDGAPYRLTVYEDYKRVDHSINAGFFIQDSWSPTKNLTLNLGLRYDMAQGRFPPQKKLGADEWVYEKTYIPMTWHNISPRVGLSFDPLGDGKTVLKASYGRYYSPMYMLLFSALNVNRGINFKVRLNSDWTERYRYSYSYPTLKAIDPDGVTAPYSDEISLGIEREVLEDFSISIKYIQKWERNLIEDVDRTALDIDYLKETDELKWSNYTPVQGIDPQTGNPVTFYEMNEDKPDYEYFIMNIPGTSRKYRGLEIKVQKRMSHNWMMFASYVWGRGWGLMNTSRDESTSSTGYYDNPNIMINAWGLLGHQRQHQFKFQGTYIAAFGISLSAYYRFSTGITYSRSLRSIEAGIDLYQGVISVRVEPRGSYGLPSQHELNLRMEKSFKVGPGRLSAIVDGFALLNLNTTTGVGTTTDVDWQDVTAIVSPRYLRFGLAYRF